MLMSRAEVTERKRLALDYRQNRTPAGADLGAGGCRIKLWISPGWGTRRAGATRRESRWRPVRACRHGHERGGGRTAARLRREGQRVHMPARRSGHSGRSRSKRESVGKRYLSRLPPTLGRPQTFRAVTRTHRSVSMPVLPGFKPFSGARTLTDMERFEIATSPLRTAGTENDVVPGRHCTAALPRFRRRPRAPVCRGERIRRR
jgi:hypothetical protein